MNAAVLSSEKLQNAILDSGYPGSHSPIICWSGTVLHEHQLQEPYLVKLVPQKIDDTVGSIRKGTAA